MKRIVTDLKNYFKASNYKKGNCWNGLLRIARAMFDNQLQTEQYSSTEEQTNYRNGFFGKESLSLAQEI